jgi:TRAP-type C4-dicarboxylate transport system substrate-binding protein
MGGMKMKKCHTILITLISLLLVMSFLFALPCIAKEASKPLVLNVTLHWAPPPKVGAANDQASLVYWTKEIEKQTEGRVKFKIFYSSVLGKVTDFAKMVGGVGVADVGAIIAVYTQWQLPLFAGTMNPFLTTGIDVQARAINKLYHEWAPMRDEWTKLNLKPLWFFVIDPYRLIIKEEISSLDDLKGKKIWGGGGYAQIMKIYDITPVFFPPAQVYEAMQKGTIDGLFFPYGPSSFFKFYELGKYYVDMTFMGCQTPSAIAINLDVWNKISPDDQKTIERISAGMHKFFLDYSKKDAQRLNNFFKSEGVTFVNFSPEEQARIRDRCAEAVLADWVEKTDKKGAPGKEFLRRYKAIVSELR